MNFSRVFDALRVADLAMADVRAALRQETRRAVSPASVIGASRSILSEAKRAAKDRAKHSAAGKLAWARKTPAERRRWRANLTAGRNRISR